MTDTAREVLRVGVRPCLRVGGAPSQRGGEVPVCLVLADTGMQTEGEREANTGTEAEDTCTEETQARLRERDTSVRVRDVVATRTFLS